MPQVLNVRHLPGFSQRRPALPPGAVYIGRASRWYRLPHTQPMPASRPSRPAVRCC
jgi:hypothetical protein